MTRAYLPGYFSTNTVGASMSYILRVDDVGQDLDQSKPDKGLTTFRRWWDAAQGWEGLPIYVGVVPACLGWEEIKWLEEHIKPPAEIALHGWDHSDQPLTGEDIEAGLRIFPQARVVIPPYNRYNSDTINSCLQLGIKFILGGFNQEHHNYGSIPVTLGRVVEGRPRTLVHISAERDYYDRCYRLNFLWSNLRNRPFSHPVQVVLHHRWDAPFLDGVRQFSSTCDRDLIGVDELERQLLLSKHTPDQIQQSWEDSFSGDIRIPGE